MDHHRHRSPCNALAGGLFGARVALCGVTDCWEALEAAGSAPGRGRGKNPSAAHALGEPSRRPPSEGRTIAEAFHLHPFGLKHHCLWECAMASFPPKCKIMNDVRFSVRPSSTPSVLWPALIRRSTALHLCFCQHVLRETRNRDIIILYSYFPEREFWPILTSPCFFFLFK